MQRTLIATALVLTSLPLSAGPITVTLGGTPCASAGQCTSQASATTIDFDSLAGYAGTSYTSGIATYSWSGQAPFVQGTLASNYATPYQDTTGYLSVGSPNRA